MMISVTKLMIIMMMTLVSGEMTGGHNGHADDRNDDDNGLR